AQGVGTTLTAGRPGDEGDLPVQLSHGSSFLPVGSPADTFGAPTGSAPMRLWMIDVRPRAGGQ
ncbi:MAG: hypothetical protein M0Z30_04290, partial [Actinomycetota bacterium]|nr:hypothetical protein [Actinomycetota bacterium]